MKKAKKNRTAGAKLLRNYKLFVKAERRRLRSVDVMADIAREHGIPVAELRKLLEPYVDDSDLPR